MKAIWVWGRAAVLAAAVCSVTLVPVTWGQDAEPAAPPAEPAEPADEPDVAEPAPPGLAPVPFPDPAGLGEAVQPEIRVERSIYLPYDDLKSVFEEDGRGVFLPYREFQALWDELQMDTGEDEEKPPAESAVVSASYRGHVEDEVAVVEATIVVESFKKGWAVLPLGASLGSVAAVEAGDAHLRLADDGYELLMPREGRYELQLQLFAKVTESAGRYEVSLSLPRTPVARFDLTVPGEGWAFELNPPTAYTATEVPGEATQLAFFFGTAESVAIAWKKRGGETMLDALLLVDADIRTDIVPGAVRSEVNAHYRILRAAVERFELAVPHPHEILEVRGDNIREWTVEGDGDTRRVVVALHRPAEGEYQIGLSLEAPLATLPAEVPVPAVTSLGVARQSGSVEVRADPEFDVDPGVGTGLTRLAGAEAGAAAGEGPRPVGTFRYLATPFELGLTVQRAVPEVEATSLTAFDVSAERLRFETSFVLEVKRAGVFGIRVGLPAGYENVQASGEAVRAFEVIEPAEDGGAPALEVSFGSERSGGVTFTVKGEQFRDAPGGDVEVPLLSPEDVTRHEAKVGVYVEEGLSPTTRETGGLRQIDVSDLAPADPFAAQAGYQFLRESAAARAPATLAFRYRGGAEPAVLGVEQKETQVFADVLQLVRIREQVAGFRWDIVYSVRYAGTDAFILRVPSEVAADLRLENTDIKEVVKDIDAATLDGVEAQEGTVLWKVVSRDRQKGEYTLHAALDVPLGAVETGSTFDVTVPELEAAGVFRETGQIAVVKDLNLEIVRPEVVALEEIDPSELRGHLVGEGAFLAYKFRERPVALTLAISKNQYLPVPAALVTYAAVDTVVSTDLATTSEVVLWLRNNSKQFLGVALPDGARVVSDIFVDGVPQQPMKRADQNGILVRLPAENPGASQESTVRFAYVTEPADGSVEMNDHGRFSLDPIVLTDADILQSQVTLFLPQDYVYVRFGGAMRQPVEDRGWMRYRGILHWLVPALGPDVMMDAAPQWSPPPPRPEAAGGGFDFDLRREGRPVRLHRLDRPTPIEIGYRSRRLAYTLEALAALAAFGVGMLFWKASAGAKFGYALVAGFGSLIVAGAVAPGWAPVWHMVFVGVVFAVAGWILLGCVDAARAWRRRRRRASPGQGEPPHPPGPGPRPGAPATPGPAARSGPGAGPRPGPGAKPVGDHPAPGTSPAPAGGAAAKAGPFAPARPAVTGVPPISAGATGAVKKAPPEGGRGSGAVESLPQVRDEPAVSGKPRVDPFPSQGGQPSGGGTGGEAGKKGS